MKHAAVNHRQMRRRGARCNPRRFPSFFEITDWRPLKLPELSYKEQQLHGCEDHQSEKMAIKVYGSYKSACTLRVIACLVEKELEFELVEIDLDANEQKKPEFLARQPFGQVPAIEDGDFRLFESRAIARYILTKYASRGADLLGSTPEERALVDQWVEVEAHNFNDLVFSIVFHLFILPRMGLPGDPELARDCEEKLGRVLDVYEKRLGSSRYLAGEQFTLADLSHLPATNFLITEVGKGHLVTERQNVKRWWEDVTGRPAWKKTMKLLP